MKNPSKNHLIIYHFIDWEKPEIKNNKIFWAREMKIAGKLLKFYPFEFLVQAKEPFFPLKMNSLSYFIGENGKNFLNNEYFEYKKSKIDLTAVQQQIKLEEKPIGDNLKIETKPKTLQEFLGMFKKEIV